MAEDLVLVLRTCKADMTSHNRFLWPESGPISCPDWNPKPICGGGLHGFLWGEGAGELADWSVDAKWLVVAVPAATIVSLEGKVKFPAGDVVYCGDRLTATAYLADNGGRGRSIVGGTSTSGHGGTSTSGHGGTSTSGDRGTSTSGDDGTSTSGTRGTLIFSWWDILAQRSRFVTAYVGEDGILPDCPYVLDSDHKVVPAPVPAKA